VNYSTSICQIQKASRFAAFFYLQLLIVVFLTDAHIL